MLSDLFSDWTDPTVGRIILTALVLVTWLVLSVIVRALIARRLGDSSSRYTFAKGANYIIGALALIALLRVWLQGGTGLAAYLGILSAGLAIAMQDPLTNLAGWIFIVGRRPFVLGDRIEIGPHAGDVVDVRMFQFSLIEIRNWVDADQSTGRIIHMPNGIVFRETIANFTQGFNFIWDEIAVTVTFESNWRRAKEILGDIAERHSAIASEHAAEQVRVAAHKFLIQYSHLTPIVWTSVADIGVTLTLRYLCEPRRRRSTANNIWEATLEAFAACDDIDFAYPTQRFYDNRLEGKPSAGGPPAAEAGGITSEAGGDGPGVRIEEPDSDDVRDAGS